MTNKNKVFVENNEHEYEQMFINNGYEVVDKIQEADILCLIGGNDVDPVRYKHLKHPTTWSNKKLDSETFELYKYARFHKMFIVGICRGGQFINVMNGGVMYQDVDNHCVPHNATNLITREKVIVSSSHHQMMYPPVDGQVVMLGEPRNTRGVIYAPEVGGFVTLEIDQDIEAVWFENSKCFAFQPHPEYDGYDECCDAFFQMLEELMSR